MRSVRGACGVMTEEKAVSGAVQEPIKTTFENAKVKKKLCYIKYYFFCSLKPPLSDKIGCFRDTIELCIYNSLTELDCDALLLFAPCHA